MLSGAAERGRWGLGAAERGRWGLGAAERGRWGLGAVERGEMGAGAPGREGGAGGRLRVVVSYVTRPGAARDSCACGPDGTLQARHGKRIDGSLA
jgi:hypothetical protein